MRAMHNFKSSFKSRFLFMFYVKSSGFLFMFLDFFSYFGKFLDPRFKVIGPSQNGLNRLSGAIGDLKV